METGEITHKEFFKVMDVALLYGQPSAQLFLDTLHKRRFGVDIIYSILKEIFNIVGFAYMEDCGLVRSISYPLTVLASIQDLINSWGSLMEVTGGSLSPEKSQWYLVDCVWNRDKQISHDTGGGYNLIAAGPTGQIVALSRLSCSDSSEMLGVQVDPNGDTSKQISILKEASIDWGGKIKLSNGSPREAWIALHTNISAN